MRPVDPGGPSEAHSAKERLFGTGETDHLRKKVAKARFLAALNVPSGGDETAHTGSLTEPMTEGASAPIGEPVRIGGFTVLHKLGQGGMGVVYAAYDDELDRKVALKLLRSGLARDSRGRLRMLREAKALARLSHPNVVQVYKIDTWNDQDFVAMEFVKGQTLNRWVEAEPRTWSEILEVLIGAGRGLAEAHRFDLVHRDFKPANILVGEHGRPRVLDFGLARAAGESPAVSELIETGEDTIEQLRAESSIGDVSRTGSQVFDQLLTATGSVLGTPAYMAPEQHLGQRATELSDQFSFCLVAYEALFGERAHKTKSGNRREYAAKVVEGNFTVPGPQSGVPKWLRDAICRGLAPEPKDRWASMEVLLAELERERSRRWRQFSVAAGLVACIASVVIVQSSSTPAPAPVCEIDGSVLADTWSETRRADLAERFRATGLAGSGAILDQTVELLEDYAGALVEAQVDACEAHGVEHSQTDAQFELRMACLQQREDELDAAITALEGVDASNLARSPQVLDTLGDIQLCGELDALEQGVPVPKDTQTAEGIRTARRDIARAAAARGIGHLEDALLIAADVRVRAEEFAYLPLLAEVALLEAVNASTARDYERAREAALRSVGHATEAGDAQIATEAWLELASIYAHQGVEPGDALEVARAHVARLGNLPRHRFELENTRGRALHTLGKLEQSLAAFDRAIALASEGFAGSDRLEVEALKGRASVLSDMGEYTAVRRDLERALEFGDRLGAQSPVMLDTLYDLAVTEMEAGELDAAGRHFDKVLAGFARVFGPSYTYIGHVHLARVWMAMQQENLELAEEELTRAFEILDPAHDDHDYALDAAATLALSQERHDKAAQILNQLIARAEQSSAGVPRQAYLHGNLGRVLSFAGRDDQALVELDRAMELYGQLEPNLDALPVLVRRAEILVSRGQLDSARETFEQALALAPLNCGRAVDAALVRVELARLLRRRGEHERQRRLAREAFELLEEMEELPLRADAKDLAETSL